METTILVVDGSKIFLHMMRKILLELGYKNVRSAQNMDEAKQFLTDEKISLVFSDWNLPGGTGMELLKFARTHKHHEAAPFLLVTSERKKSNIFEAARAGVKNYIFKPVTKDIIKKKLYALVKDHPSINSPHEAL